ncbi:hypothetical protein C0992_006678 [Termitomyces sp. T32_za158]|nr:hypothetical protein C0992_006678 [Termitomyces sp. T32_za158]
MDAFINQVLRTLAAMPPVDVQPVQHDEHDVPMDTDNNDDLPDLQSVSDSSDSDDELHSDSSQDEEEVVMQTVDEENIPPPEPISPPHTTSNRRPRVDNDDDEERDRRHPSQRINNPLDATIPENLLSSDGPINVPVVPIPPGMTNAAPEGQDNQNQANQDQPPPVPQTHRHWQRPPIINGFAVTIDLNGQRIVRPLPAIDPGNQGVGLTDFLGFLSALSERETDDPERAKQLVDALEEVPVGLVRRLEALNGKLPSGNGEGDGMGAGDCSCAICWDTLLDGEGGFGVDSDDKTQVEEPQHAEREDALSTPTSPSQDTAPVLAPTSTPPTSKKLVSSTDPAQPKIVSLPCAHVFHAACLIPWFSRPRQTTCPTCRFNIDPEKLTARRQPFIPSFDFRNRWAGRQGQTGEQQQQGEAPPPNDANTDNPDEPTNPEPQTQTQTANPANAGQPHPQPHRNPGHTHGPLPGAVLTIGFDIIIGPNPNHVGHNANPINVNPDSNPAHNTNMNPGADAENAFHNHDQHQNQNQNQGPTFMDLDMGMGGMAMGMGMGGMGDMNDAEIEEVTMMDLSDAQARELGEILRVALPHPHPHPPRPPPPTDPPVPPAPDPRAVPDGGAAQLQQEQQQHHRPAPGFTNVFTGTVTGRTMGEALASLFSQPLQQGQAGLGARGNQPQSQQDQAEAQGEQGASAEQQGQAAQAQDIGGGQQAGQGQGQGQGQGPAQMPNAPIFRDFLNAVFASMAQAQGQGQRQTTGGQGAGGVPGFVLAPLPISPPAATIGGTPVFNLGNLIAGLDVLGSPIVGGGGGNQANVNNNIGTETNDEATGLNARGTDNANATEALANPNAADANANPPVHAPGPAMNIPFIPFASLFPGATLTPPPAFGMAQPPAQAVQQQEQPAVPQAQPQADDGSPLSGLMRMLPDIFSQSLNAANGTNALNVPQQQPQQPQQQAGERALPLPPWARFFQPQPFNPSNLGPIPAGAAQPAQVQAQTQTPSGQPQQAPPGPDGQVPPTASPRVRRERAPREKKPWTLPPPPGPTLRQRIEKREREAGFRCYDVSCGVGPSDEEPFVGAVLTEGARRQLSIRAVTPEKEAVCGHTFHPACLVSAARVANALGEDVNVAQGDFVEVGCSVCKGVGSVRREEWDEGVRALA